MLFDRFNRRIDYLRISVTDRCNHRCAYCMPHIPFVLKNHSDILSFEQIAAVAEAAAGLGITKIRLTGGEPLVRRNIEEMIAKLSAISAIEEICMTTNGSLLADKAVKLKANGLSRVNVSIDSVDPEQYRQITRGGELKQALAGIDAAVEAGLLPVKINMVIVDDTTAEDIEKMEGFCERKGLKLQKIMQFSLYDRSDLSRRFQTERPPKCVNCNRLRLTADGFLKPCLFCDDEIRVDFGDIAGSIRKAVTAKPENGSSCRGRFMNQIGG